MTDEIKCGNCLALERERDELKAQLEEDDTRFRKIMSDAIKKREWKNAKRINILVRQRDDLQAQLERLENKFPCGHRVVDWDDGYGECMACRYKALYEESEKEQILQAAQSSAQPGEEQNELWRLRAEVARLQAEVKAARKKGMDEAKELIAAFRRDVLKAIRLAMEKEG